MVRSARLRRFFLRVAFYGVVFFLVLPAVLAFVLVRAPRARISEHRPARYDEVTLLSDAMRLRAWISRGKPELPAVVIVHGLGDTLESYQEHAQLFFDRGHTVLLIDLRGHGGSDGWYTTLGGRERHDVRAAMSYLTAEGLGENGFILEGHSMGAVAVILAAADRTDIRGVIAEAPYDSFRNTVEHHAKLLFKLPPWFPLIPLSIWGAERIAGFDADDVDTVAAASRLKAPLLAIVDGEDRRMPESVVRRIVDAHPGSNRMWIAPGVGHVGAIHHSDWRKVVEEFLDSIAST
jgi:pimeloyl-ACP methyl ester carboxylesterase